MERPQNDGSTSVPLPPEREKAADVALGFKNGDRAHPCVHATADRRCRMKNLKPRESAHHDDQGQNTHIARDGVDHTAKQHVMSATEGSKPLTMCGLNEQMEGHAARTAQLEHSLHGLFDVTSLFGPIVQQQLPAVAAVAPLLDQDPSGPTDMADAIRAG